MNIHFRMQHGGHDNTIVMAILVTMCMFIAYACSMHHHGSGRSKGQKSVCCFLKIGHFRLSIAVPLRMYSKFGQTKWILVGQIL